MQKQLIATLKILIISAILTLTLYFFFLVTDIFGHFYNAPLLLNIDFLANYQYINVIEELIIHFTITLTIVIVTTIVYKNFNNFKLLYLTLLMIAFILLYPLLITLSKRNFFHYDIKGYCIWIIAHLVFLILLNISIKKLLTTNK